MIDQRTRNHGVTVEFPSCEQAVRCGVSVGPLDDHLVRLWGYELDGTDSCIEQCRRWLDEEERERAIRFVHAVDQRRFVLAHGILRVLMGCYLNHEPGAVQFGRERHGKPFVSEGTTRSPLRFSMAHSNGRVLIGVTRRHEIGVDLEYIREDTDVLNLAGRFYASAELAMLARLSPAEQRTAFFRYWAGKEAVLKGQGMGLPALHECEIVPSANGLRAEICARSGSMVQPNWSLRWLCCGEHWAGAVAGFGTNWVMQSESR